MGYKYPVGIGMKRSKTASPTSIFNNENPYGYRLNVNHPVIKKLYEGFKIKHGIRIPSDKERRQFEDAVPGTLERRCHD